MAQRIGEEMVKCENKKFISNLLFIISAFGAVGIYIRRDSKMTMLQLAVVSAICLISAIIIKRTTKPCDKMTQNVKGSR